MKRKVSIFGLTLLLICMLSIAFNTSLVQARDPTIGKFLTINFAGEGYVTAEKVKSGEIWYFYPGDLPQRVGAGTVLLTAHASEGWEFFEWIGDVDTPSVSPTDYKTVKYGEVKAVFVKTRFTITVSALGNGEGTLYLDDEPVNWGTFDFEYGKTAIFTFESIGDDYISSVAVNGIYEPSYVEGVTFSSIDADQTLDVYFSLKGTAFVPPGPNVFLFLNQIESVEFTNAAGGGIATVTDLEEIKDYPIGALAAGWEITVDFTLSGEAIVTLYYDERALLIPEEELRLIEGETLEAIRSDVNNDQRVDGDDVSDVANAVKKYPDWYDPLCDLNNDNRVDELDLHIVNENKGAILEDITEGQDVDADLIWGIIDDFNSIFGVR